MVRQGKNIPVCQIFKLNSKMFSDFMHSNIKHSNLEHFYL